MNVIYEDGAVILAIKPAGVLSTDEPGGMPELLRAELNTDEIRTVHRLDRVVSGLMLLVSPSGDSVKTLARSSACASELSRQIREGEFHKEYLAVVHGVTAASGELRDLMYRDKARRMSFVTDTPAVGVQEARLEYDTLESTAGLSLVRVRLITGRTHQIRCQFASHGWPLVGERKYDVNDDNCPIALWSHRLRFAHPVTGEQMDFAVQPPETYPWTLFAAAREN